MDNPNLALQDQYVDTSCHSKSDRVRQRKVYERGKDGGLWGRHAQNSHMLALPLLRALYSRRSSRSGRVMDCWRWWRGPHQIPGYPPTVLYHL